MPTSTPNLSLYKYNTNTDGNMTFNITNSLNNNWDKIDTYCKNLSDNKADKSAVNSALALKADTSVVNSALALKADLADLDTKANITQLHALKGYEDAGELLTDAEGLNDVIKYAHSSFDLSKFTVVGSPTITDDGIASGFSSDNYVMANGITLGSLQNKSFEIKIKFKVGEKSQAIWNPNIDWGPNRFAISYVAGTSYKEFRFYSQFGSSDSAATDSYQLLRDGVNGSNINVGDIYELKYKFDYPNNLTFSICKEGTNNIISANNTAPEGFTDVGLYAINHYPNGLLKLYPTNNNTQPQDLKQFSITVDGVEVFSGNKTGIDTIKPDDYTILGDSSSVVITDDGILKQSYATTTPKGYPLWDSSILPTPDGKHIYRFEQKWSINNNTVINYFMCIPIVLVDDAIFAINSRQDKYIYLSVFNGVSNTAIKTSKQINTNTIYNTVIETDFTTFLRCLCDGEIIYENMNYAFPSGYAFRSLASFSCYYAFASNYDFSGENDLNAFKIYVDGNLVYQPCLKIPYTKGSEQYGGKYVNAQYLPRVKDAYEQGLANDYFTLDEANGTYTLPMGNLYGMIEKLNQLSKDEIGLPKATLSNTLNDNEIWLEGAEVSKLTYSKLYAIYGDDYGTPTDSANFVLPDFRDRVMQGIGSGGTFGYIEAGLPNIKGKQNEVRRDGDPNNNGALHSSHTRTGVSSGTGGGQAADIYFDASWSNSIYGNSTTVQPPAIKVRFKTRFQ